MSEIKVVHLCYSDNYGGASIAMKRISKAISTQKGVKSIICTVIKSNDCNVINLNENWFFKCWQYFITRFSYKFVEIIQRTNNPSGRSINIFPSGLVSRLNRIDFDILHLHWIGNETIRIEDLKKINKPIFWTFHDTWPILGAEHTDTNFSKRFVDGYTSANRPFSSKGIDLDRFTWERKKRTFEKLNIKPIVVSSWLKELTESSYLWRKSKPVVISNPIDVDDWQIINKDICQKNFDIVKGTNVIAFGAVNAFNDELKGYNLLFDAVKLLAFSNDKEMFCLVVFGDPLKYDKLETPNLRILSLGILRDLKTINHVYCAANVTAIPSYMETFGQVALESILCGTPVVAFRTSGLVDIIEDGHNGFFAEPYIVKSLEDVLDKSLKNKWDQINLRNSVSNKFNLDLIGEKYVNEYLKYL